MLLCRNNLTPIQRRSMQRVGVVLLLTVLTNLSNSSAPKLIYDVFPGLARDLAGQQASPAYAIVLSALSLLPVLLAVWIAANYLKAESDEFVRTLVVKALLWGFAVTMAGDAVLGVLTTLYSKSFPISLLNADLFFPSTGIAFRLLHRGYR